jgi:hypothetical protein
MTAWICTTASSGRPASRSRTRRQISAEFFAGDALRILRRVSDAEYVVDSRCAHHRLGTVHPEDGAGCT